MIQEIKCGRVSAKIDSLGGQLLSLKKDGVEYIWQGDPKYWKNHSPILFPVVGRLRNGVLTVKGQDYAMPIHGFLRDSELTVTDKTEASITFALKSNKKTKEVYPWDFYISIHFSLEGNTLHTRFFVENQDAEEMLFGLGGHPGFNVPMVSGASFSDYQLEFEKEERLDSNECNMETVEISAEKKDTVLDGGRVLPLERSLFDNEAMIFEDIQSRWVNLVHKDTGKGIRFAYGNFPILAIWSSTAPKEAPLVCLEPWYSMGFRDNEDSNIENKYGMQRLASGETFTAEYSIGILD